MESTAKKLVHFQEETPKQGLYNPEEEHDACGVGFVADLTGTHTRATITDALHVLNHLTHRGACGCESETGDGAGIIVGMPDKFLRKVAKAEGVDLPPKGRYAVANIFFVKDEKHVAAQKKVFDEVVSSFGLNVLLWRKMPVRPTYGKGLGATAMACEPYQEQLFVGAPDNVATEQGFNALLFEVRQKAQYSTDAIMAGLELYICSLSANVVTYKGMLKSEQVMEYYQDLEDVDFESHCAMVHSRFATNTFPAWSRAHPYRYIAHNGEINTVRGNKNWQRAREGVISSPLIPALAECCPIIQPHGSDSQAFDNVVELLVNAGRTLPEAVLLMMPEAWQNNELMDTNKRAFYKYSAASMEPWDGPALVLFTDGNYLGATLDRNGLRPCRYYVTKDKRVIGGSEVGVLAIPPEDIVEKGRLMPGKMFLLDFKQGKMISDAEYKNSISTKNPYAAWIEDKQLTFANIPQAPVVPVPEADKLAMLRVFGYTQETLDYVLSPMAIDGMEGLGSMGNDVPLACLSKRSRTVFEFFKQLFAQVTNPPIDPIRESVVMTLECWIGPERNILETTADHVNRIYLDHPLITNEELAALKTIDYKGYTAKVLDCTYSASDPGDLAAAIKRVCAEASKAAADGAAIIVLSDRATCSSRVPIAAPMVCGAVHHHLVNNLQRTRVALVVESGEPREVHHFCVMAGFGADAVNPYMAFLAIERLIAEDPKLKNMPLDKAVYNYKKALGKGMLKVFAKMGVSTLMSYKGAQVFEALGLGKDVIDLCFCGVASRIGGLSLKDLGQDYINQHAKGFLPRPVTDVTVEALENPGDYHYRATPGAEAHINDPAAIAAMQDAARTGSRAAFSTFSKLHDEATERCTLRGQLEFSFDKCTPIPLDQVEDVASIVKRFRTGAMSYGSISMEAHATLAVGMNRINAKSNTGEGGEDPARWEQQAKHGDKAGDTERSSIKQVASGRFGVTINYLTNADELQIKMAQGAKPGEGGELPGNKVNATIAKCRNSTIGVGLISPPPHHDIYSIEDLSQLIYDLKNANRGADVSVKLVSEVGVGTVAAGVAKGKADHILIAGHDGGTGASRWTGIKHAGLPFELGIAETHQTLVLNGLRGRVSLETDGCLRNGRDVAMAALFGAEMFGFATAPLIAMGCIMMRKCHLNTCPVGIATQDPELRLKFKGQPEHVVNYLFLVAEECREIMAKLGYKSIPEMVGHAELLRPKADMVKRNPKLAGLDLSALTMNPSALKSTVLNLKDVDSWLKENHKIQEQDHGVGDDISEGLRVVDHHLLASVVAAVKGTKHTVVGEYHKHNLVGQTLLKGATKDVTTFADALTHLRATGGAVEIVTDVTNLNRSMGTIMSNEIAKVLGEDATPFGPNPLAPSTIVVKTRGSAGQSFGAFLAAGIELDHEGDTNDYIGKGLCGGKIAVYPSTASTFAAEHNIAIGNVALYGATGGKLFVRGIAAERFAVRNSGASAVAEGCGDHGCEYMTGGRVVILGPVGINFAAGMSGGRAYLYDPAGDSRKKCSDEADPAKEYTKVSSKAHEDELKGLLSEHLAATGSAVAKNILDHWASELDKFLEVFPTDFKKALSDTGKGAAPKDATANLTADEKEMINDDPNPDTKVEMKDVEDMARPIVVDKPIKKRGFIEYERGAAKYIPEAGRSQHFLEIYEAKDEKKLATQGARCMDCGVPFCHQKETGCPLGNTIPEWNNLVYQGRWKDALQRLLMTNNFPEFTGRVCPAPCEGACVLGIIEQPVTIKNIECAIIDKAFEEGWIVPRLPTERSGKKVAVIGSGPAGMAAADQLNKAGHLVTVFERADRVGGLMMYGVPNMKADKEKVVQRRVDLMAKEGIIFKTGSAGNIGGKDHPLGNELLVGSEPPPTCESISAEFDAIVCATGATAARDMLIPGRELNGVHLAMEFLHKNTKSLLDSGEVGESWMAKNNGQRLDAKGKKVVVIGGGDTGNDCIGTSIRHGATSVVNFELLPQPPDSRASDNPWPQWPRIYRVDYGHQEVAARDGKDPREFLINSKRFIGDADGNLTGIETVRVEWAKDAQGRFAMSEVPGSEQVFECDLCMLSMGFLGPEKTLIDDFKLAADPRGNIKADFGAHVTSVSKVFAAGDCRRGQSLVVWAIREGRECAREVDRFLMGSTSLP